MFQSLANSMSVNTMKGITWARSAIEIAMAVTAVVSMLTGQFHVSSYTFLCIFAVLSLWDIVLSKHEEFEGKLRRTRIATFIIEGAFVVVMLIHLFHS